MPFLSLNNTDVKFVESDIFTWKSYDNAKVLLITSWVQLIDKHKFAKVALNRNFDTFVVYVAAIEVTIAVILIYLSQTAQIAVLQ